MNEFFKNGKIFVFKNNNMLFIKFIDFYTFDYNFTNKFFIRIIIASTILNLRLYF